MPIDLVEIDWLEAHLDLEEYLDDMQCRAPAERLALREHLHDAVARTRLPKPEEGHADKIFGLGVAKYEAMKKKFPRVHSMKQLMTAPDGETWWTQNVGPLLSVHKATKKVLKEFGAPPEKQSIRLEHLEKLTEKFVTLVDWTGRGLLPPEQRAFRWIRTLWEQSWIKAAILMKTGAQKDRHHELMGQLREALRPYPGEGVPSLPTEVEAPRLKHRRVEKRAELCAGNFALKTAHPHEGTSIARLGAMEATRRITRIGELSNVISVIISELALVRNRDRPEAKRIARLAKRLVKMSRTFAARSTPVTIPAVKSIEETMEHMRQMNALMAPAPVEPRKVRS